MIQTRANCELLPNRRRRLTVSLFSFAAAFGLIAFGSSQAHATCGDYLSHHEMIAGGSAPTPGNPGHSGTTPRHIPCHGPSCQQGPASLPLSAPVVSVDPQDRWGWTAMLSVTRPEQTSTLAPFSEPVALPTIAYRLDRPPKS